MKSSSKNEQRQRRTKRTRMHIRELQAKNPNLVMVTVFKSNQHMYAAGIIYDAYSGESKVVASASTVEKAVSKQCENKTGNKVAAQVVGKVLAERVLAAKVPELKVAFDKSGYKYHGRVKALADAAREAGLDF